MVISMSELLLCTSQTENTTAYTFKMTGMSVFSLEEALYHCFHYWKESTEDFCSEEFVSWLHGLGLVFYAKKIAKLRTQESLTQRLLSFLTLIDYFNEAELDTLKTKLSKWESRMEWERLKDRGDFFFKKEAFAEAVHFYKKSSAIKETPTILNNVGVSFMHLKRFTQANESFTKALALYDGKLHKDTALIQLNAAESLIYSKLFHEAEDKLRNVYEWLRSVHDQPDTAYETALKIRHKYLTGLLFYETGIFEKAISALEGLKLKEGFYLKARCHIKLRQFDKATTAVEQVLSLEGANKPENYEEFLKNQAQVFAESNNIPAAIKAIEKALIVNPNAPRLWVLLARYYRLDYNLTLAASAISKALNLKETDTEVLMEQARIKKAQGKIRDYQLILGNILKEVKKIHR